MGLMGGWQAYRELLHIDWTPNQAVTAARLRGGHEALVVEVLVPQFPLGYHTQLPFDVLFLGKGCEGAAPQDT